MESVAFIQWCLDHLNYWTITLLMTIESSFIPFPSEIVVPPAAYKASVNDEMNIFLVVLFATIGADIGALINYYLAKWLGRPIVYKFANSRFGHICLIDEAKVQHAEEYFEKRGALSTFIGRLIPAVRQLISIPAGLARMKMSTFLLYTTLGAGLWNSILAFIGYYLSTVPGIETEEQLLAKVTEYSHELSYIFIGIAVFIIGFLIYKGMKKGKKEQSSL
ncbi:DedA family protein [Bacteroides sp. UBA939]|uniref:DedA family protein n=1 Tax=Bacteroides sp. UBA939 TaxID=1946092 RepID=UPI0025BCF833|nr:DedA family protein [Bacteroides sp. UBA939]